MICGELRELKYYRGISENLDKAIDMIEKGEYLKGKPGKNEINEGLYFNCETAVTEDIEDRFFEGHKKYIDIHILISGKEKIGYSPRSEVVRTEPWDRIKDFEIYEGSVDHIFEMAEDRFIMFFPEEPHMPLIQGEDGPQTIQKAVFKIACKL